MAGTVDKSLPMEYQTQQSQMNILGFWVFLGAEIVLFATLFATYFVLQDRTVGGPTAQDMFVLRDVLILTFILLTSSFTCGLAIHEMRRNNENGVLLWLAVTMVLGMAFIGMEVFEFIHYVDMGATMQTSAFLSSLYALLGTHGLHVTLGVGWMLAIILQVYRRGLTHVTTRKIFIVSLYWHFLDVVWIFIFTFVYIQGMVM
ncbi:cytochrome aa3 quinol oxidase subunit III [Anaerobacillus alkaliphilus]|uniref:Quinol oxidase subunit 3 n=1 Tax=Anaerobacillus alkaliphilus TaxID=1548597 RepID=A0A4Q0VTZ3_9BACI|nr:cytochrome aa3 quinol oxidase subunit III [Anaerobacillus alkaliphilus]RXJ01778.1 cytochrome aa3 quinol oxidase subunit III [Anaerobacillus alkaliphilus]